MSHSAMSMAENASVKIPPGPAEPAAASRSFWPTASTRSGSSPTRERTELLDGMLQRGGERGAEEGDADALDARVGLDLHRDELAERPAEGRPTRERLIGRQLHEVGMDAGDLHG